MSKYGLLNRLAIVLVVGLGTLTGCSGQAVDTDSTTGNVDLTAPSAVTDRDMQEMVVPGNWLGKELGLKPPKLRPVGKVTLAKGDPESLRPIDTESAAPDQPVRPGGHMMATGPDGTIYEVLFDEQDLAVLNRELLKRGESGTSNVGAVPPEQPIEKGWSGGSDNRVRYTTPYNNGLLRTMGVLSPNSNQPFQGAMDVGPCAPYRTLSHPFSITV